jgi:hypothetical protein
VSTLDVRYVMLVLLPVAAAIVLGLLVGSLVAGGRGRWWVWLLLLVGICLLWAYYFSGTP